MNFISLYLEGKNVSVCTLIKNFLRQAATFGQLSLCPTIPI